MIPAPPAPVDLPLPPLARLDGGVRVGRGIPYADRPRARPLELDVYLPDDESPCAAALFIHGGAWQRGSRRGAGPMYRGSALFERAARAGLAVISIDYRLSGEAHWPAQRDDVQEALAWVLARADELVIKRSRLGVWGESAGGHLALHLALTRPSDVARVVAWYPPTDLLSHPAMVGQDPLDPGTPEALLLGHPATANPERARDASPVSHVGAVSPPMLLLHGEADRVVSCEQTRTFAAAASAAGAPVTVHTYAGADHVWLGTPDVADDAVTRSIDFLLGA